MIFWLVAFVLFVAPVLVIARFAWPKRRRTGLALATGLAGSLVGLVGLLALLFNGYVEDYGSLPAETLGLAATLLSESALLYALAWAVAKSEDGMKRDQLQRCLEDAGFNLGPVAHLLRD